ncbi:hypothetical protein AAFF_G00290230 [Aldrovandia affinis]|uniref:Laminin subunit alpha-3-like n=1 Tax=Aldrovandia affinis TaxID=143900 RepID=A0AAD7R9F4_9TELE|nr:hypothetical protein AAFF_G00290230 [Aldrovandia affinis]
MARGTNGADSLALLSTVTLILLGAVRAQVPVNDITGFSLSPPYFNLAEGARISATATCGEDESGMPRSDLYCKLVGGPTTGLSSQTIQGQFCERCYSSDPNAAHPASNAVDGTERWWQSPPLSRGVKYNEVNLTLDLGQLFHVAYVLIKFANSPRPDLWVLERSLDHGRTYVPWQYFTHLKRDCLELFGKQPNARIVRDDDQICTTEYSRIVPLENGEIVVSLVNGRPGARNFTFSPVLRDFTKATNIRLRFLRTTTLLGHLISKAQRDPTVTRRYYYSIKDISVGGRCVCHGHALACGARSPNNPNRLQCECRHNTCGESCDRCCPGFNQKPWRVATTDSANECQPCQCHSHATDCYYDPDVDRRAASLNIYGRFEGGGVCINCQHNTAGVNCERCAAGFYRPYRARPDSPNACTPCRCDTRTTAGCEDGLGRCICKPNFSGDNCDRCADGYYRFPECIRYPAYQTTTKFPAGHIVDPLGCTEGYFGPPTCQPCRCGGPGAAVQTCDIQTGDCQCRTGFEGKLCDRCAPGRFNYPYCQGCVCNSEGTLPEGCDGSGQCLCRAEVEGAQCDRCRPGYHSFPNCQVCRCDGAGVADGVCGPWGDCRCRASYAGRKCEQCAPGYYGYPNCAACQCSRDGSYEESCDPASGQCRCRPGVTGQRCDRCVEGGRRFPQCAGCVCNSEGTLPEVCEPSGRCLCRTEVEGAQCNRCRPGYHSFPNCQACQCSRDGSYEESCDSASGQCRCRPGVTGQRCDRCVEAGRRFPQCAGCVCNSEGTLPEVCEPSGRCLCRTEVEGAQCDRCRPGYHSFPNCQACQCSRDGSYEESCDPASGQCRCRPGVTGQRCDRCVEGGRRFPQCAGCVCNSEGPCRRCEPSGRCLCRTEVEGAQCDRCRPGYHSFPNCQGCVCNSEGTLPEVCEPSGRCLCRAEVEGAQCDRCRPGYHSFPNCQACQCSRDGSYEESCDPASGQCRCRPGVTGQRCDRCVEGGRRFPQCAGCVCNSEGTLPEVCEPSGRCLCRTEVEGAQCDRCRPGYHSFPNCQACQCSRDGSYEESCDPASGQCRCRPGVTGQRCDRCVEGGRRFPQCAVPESIGRCNPAGTDVNRVDPNSVHCPCLADVEGLLCDRCRPLFWNLAPENPKGCIECQCEVKGTLSGVGECEQQSGKCFCKPNACGHTCNTCKEGYFLLQKRNYFGCQSCECDVGGAVGRACTEPSGQCQCRKHVVGRTCNQPETNFYFPDLHHMKYEVEDGITPNARPVRFGYDPQEFPRFSWRGYATMSRAQNEVRVTVHVDETEHSLFHVVLRFANPGGSSVTGRITASHVRGSEGARQSKEMVFPPSATPAFLTIPGNGFPEPFPLTPGKWIIHIRVEGVLLDYLVLLPSSYYEAPILQSRITEPCTYLTTAENQGRNCLLYRHAPMDRFPSAQGSQGVYSSRGRRKRQARMRRPTPEHPEMASVSGRQAQLQMTLRVPALAWYALVLEYASEADTVQNANVLVSGQPNTQPQARVNIDSCAYSFLCRAVAVDGRGRVAMLQMDHKTDILLQTSTASFLLYKVYAVPAEEFSMEYVEPRVLCSSVHGRFSEDSRFCVPSQYELPTSSLVLDAVREGRLSVLSGRRQRRQVAGPLPLVTPHRGGVVLKPPQTEISFTARVPAVGRYMFVVHFRQPEHPTFPVEVQVDAGRLWKGSVNASFCPRVSGCRDQVIAERRIALDLPRQELSVMLRVPPGKTLILDYILVVPDESYRRELLKEKPLGKSSDFTNLCGGNSFHIDPSSSQFCRDSARSLVAFANDGALPCGCDKGGSTGPTCAPEGGQCPCKPNIIGRQCTRCAIGHYGFPYCRACGCGRRLCDEVTGQCICPPQTVRPTCDECQTQTFSYHPLLGCDGCDCSPTGISSVAGGDCDRSTGQCTCKERIGGRQCDHCTPGFYGFPECVPCDCNTRGVVPDVCDPQTGECLCKKNIAGVRCDMCAKGSFHFDGSNPSGCTSCFCFGATDQCQSSDKRRGKFVDMQKWHLEKPDQEEVPSVFNPASNTVVADVQELPATVHNLHWVAPPSYLGDRVSSYGGYLTYQEARRPAQWTGNDSGSQGPLTPSADKLYQGRVQLLEGNFRHEGTERPVSREEMMTVLAGLDRLRIRGLYFSQSQRLSLGEVGLEEATPTGSGTPSSTVEVCACPPGHHGDSCQEGQRVQTPQIHDHSGQNVRLPSLNDRETSSANQKCATGYYRERSGLTLGHCVPCTCNGLADECDQATGRCLSCQHNTGGDQCERCKEGYYGNATEKTCRVCPCPFNVRSNSFATGCRKVAGGFVCVCQQGYTGPRCERCAPGYYGDPMALGGSCRACSCNGNPSSCDSKTGVCKNTLEPKDTNTDEQCQGSGELGQQAEQLPGELSAAQDRLKKLEDAITATKTLVNKYNASIISQIPKVKQLEKDVVNLNMDVGLLKTKASENAEEAQEAVAEAEKTHSRAQDLVVDAQNLFQKIKDLLKQLNNSTSSGSSLPTEDLAKIQEDAERMVKEMEARDFSDQKVAAEKEREESRKLLDHIKKNVTQQCNLNKEAAKRIAGSLKEHEAKLKDLEAALKEADDAVKKANRQNELNALALEDLLKRRKELEKERDKVADEIAMAKDQLKATADLLNMLDDSKKEYEQLAAQLDGAKTDLTKKVNHISQAAAKEDIVEKAEKHAETLSRLAKDLQQAVTNASSSSDVRCAMDAIEAYKNITDAINAAERAAKEAKKAADKALKDVQQQDLTKKAKELKTNGNNLLAEAKDAQKDLKDAAAELEAQKKRLNKAEKNKEALKKDLLAAQAELDNIKGDDIADMIDDAKKTAADANSTTNDAMNRLDAIRKEVDKINILPLDSNFDNVLSDVDKSVKNLSNTIPSLLDKISQIENLNSQLSPASNVSENIKRIKELIELARDAANRITVPMKFMGDGHVELRTPTGMDDLKAYTALSLSLQRPEGPDSGRGDGGRIRRQPATDDGNLFVLYLGKKDASKDYIGMALRNNQLFCIYKLNGVEYEVKTEFITKSPSEPSYFDRVDLRRIYQDAEVIVTKLFTSNVPDPPVSYSKQGEITRNLLNLDPEDVVFYVGGYPDTFTPPSSLNYPKYKGCIEMSSFNERFISLYNFKKAVNINSAPCKRYVPSEVELYFEGSGYAKVAITKMPQVLVLGQSIYTRSENALLMYIGNADSYYTITVESGYVVFRGRVGDKVLKEEKSTVKPFPLTKPEDIQIVLSRQGTLLVRVGYLTVITASYTQGEYKSYYIGGLPPSLRERDNITAPPVKGCVRNIKTGGSHGQVEERVGMSRGCPKDFLASRKAQFSLGSSLSALPRGFGLTGDMSVSLGFKSTENEGLLLKNSQAGTGIELSLDNGFVLFKYKTKVWKSNKTYKDGKWHYLTATKKGQRLELLVDEDDEGQLQSTPSSIGASGEEVFLGADTFTGCLTNLYMRRPDALYKPEDLSFFSARGNILMDICSADRPPLLMLANRNRTASSTTEKIQNESLSGCRLPSLVKHSYRLGGSFSSLSYNITPQALRNRPHFSLDVRTGTADGLLLYVAGRPDSSHLVLYLSKGRIRLSIGRKRHIFNREKYSDDKWHTVTFSWERRKFRLVVDGLRAHDGQLSPDEGVSLDLQSPVYLGSVPTSVRAEHEWKDLPSESVIGCVRNFKMNSQPMTKPTTNHGAAPCFDGPMESGAYFSGNGGYAVIEDSFVVGISFELVFEVRPRTLTGVIFHVGGNQGHHLSLYLRRGQVVVQVNNGAGEFSVSVAPQHTLCDGMFHRVAVIKQNNVIQLDVDTEARYTVGPSSSVSTGTRDPLYVGGIPDDAWPAHLLKSSFIGCLQKVQLNGNVVSFDKILRVFGPVNLRECPAS